MRLLARRLLQLGVVFVVVTFFTVWLISLVPGDAAVVVIPFDDPQETQRTAFREENNLDKPIVERWAIWAKNFVRGDFGNYYNSTGTDPVADRISSNLPVSLLLVLYVQVFSLLVAVPLAVWAAYRSGSRLDKLLNAGAFGCISMPGFAAVLILSYYLGVQLGWLPTDGYVPFGDGAKPGKYRVVLSSALANGIGKPAYGDPAKTPWAVDVPDTGLTDQVLEVK